MIPNHPFIHGFLKQYPDIVLVMASKYIEPADFKAFYDAGITHFGESRDDAFVEKVDRVDLPITWHFLGTLQTKKVKKLIHRVDVLHSLDRLKLAKEINKRRSEPLPCFIQVNISGEAQKHGVSPEAALGFLDNLKAYPNIKVIGLMGMAEYSDDINVIRRQFKTLRDLRDTLMKNTPSIQYLSMGMTNDYEAAIMEGASHVRLGRILLQEEAPDEEK